MPVTDPRERYDDLVVRYHEEGRTVDAFAETTSIGDDLGIEDEPISDAGWFRSLPETTYYREMTKRVRMRYRGNERETDNM